GPGLVAAPRPPPRVEPVAGEPERGGRAGFGRLAGAVAPARPGSRHESVAPWLPGYSGALAKFRRPAAPELRDEPTRRRRPCHRGKLHLLRRLARSGVGCLPGAGRRGAEGAGRRSRTGAAANADARLSHLGAVRSAGARPVEHPDLAADPADLGGR